MRSRVISIRGELQIKNFAEENLSFRPFIKYLEDRSKVEKTIKVQFYQLVLNKFKIYPELKTDCITPKHAASYTEILELIYTLLSPTIEDEKQLYWALSNPSRSQIVFSTDAFSDLVNEQKKRSKNKTISNKEFKQRQTDFAYRLILEKLYNFPSDLNSDSVYALPDNKTSLTKYYRVHTDTRFINITTSKPLPEINPEMIEPFIYEGADTAILKKIIPLTMFSMEGFSVISVEDITAEHSLETIRLALINNTLGQDALYKEVINSLQTLSGNPVINFGLLPFLRINGRLIFDTPECCNSILIKSSKNRPEAEYAFNNFITGYIEKPVAMFFNTLSAQKITNYPFLKALKDAGITSYAILPVFYNKHRAGILEIYSTQRVVFYAKLLSQIQLTIPLISQLLHNTAEQLNEKLEDIVKTKFTALQPSVQWKFNEAAWRYFIDGQEKEKQDIEIVSFNNVYPLYGAIDIRDSTIYHNRALKNDTETLISALTVLIQQLKTQITNKHVTKSLSARQKTWIKKIKEFEKANDEALIKNFIERIIMPYLLALGNKYPVVIKLINTYEKAVDEKGETYKHRRELEASIKSINKTLGNYFERAQSKLLKIYPCYFEKFRSDGIEYDIYTGQDIAPAIPFHDKHLTGFRYWQLKAMIDVALLTNNLLNKMPVALQTASLIFVHSGQIDICFRNDERRFDVEGYYNIRYEVIKKRIDKVHIKNTTERLTQPGKIALVYFNDTEVEEYITFIKQFQKNQYLKKDLEFIELENLQGVTGLKALRVSVNY